MLSVDDCADFVIFIGCDTEFLLSKYYCIVAKKKYTEVLYLVIKISSNL